ncbi:O-Antigen ligase [Bifidobacterium longum]|jgi:O-antigen ligase|uniref:O-antigen ligase family protein n=1 Tax=Bifidobacterium longum subsp. longum TaxID=1679 RepID=A0AA46JXV3_BIFLL|nr:O-antigen ligase family protein [Bifidobacterium longum]MDR5629983.1 O-antigen ligase family protein [Bifidobacterium longum]PKC84694.1 O-Antigen ligase [Bifidobacterium longum]RGX34336.1 O-antigen ligase domain-containing protein [Bifidobacterium longum]RGX39893.1 O-antigen ligase domain-containing protein [Bifidobacterium longum]RGX44548.1 O-antigen ligase domain-containing protein [Bifidobacterium longum]
MSVHITKRKVILFLLLIPVFMPISVDYFTTSLHLNRLLTYVVDAYLLCRLVFSRKALSIVTVISACMYAWILLATAISHGLMDNAILSLLRIMIVCLIFDLYRNDVYTLVRVLILHCEICVYVNLLSVLVAPNGLYSRSVSGYAVSQEWFLGVDNYFVQWLFPALVVAWAYIALTRSKTRGYVLTAAVVVTEFIHGSATGIVGIVLFSLLMIIPKVKLVFTPIRSVVISVIVWLLIVVFRADSIFAPLVSTLGKDMTFTGRLNIWDNALRVITANPILGYGVLTNDAMVGYLGSSSSGVWVGATHCHDQILQVAFQGGLVALALLLVIIALIIKKSLEYWPKKVAQIAVYAVSAYLIMCTTEVFTFPVMFLIFPLSYYVLSDQTVKE